MIDSYAGAVRCVFSPPLPVRRKHLERELGQFATTVIQDGEVRVVPGDISGGFGGHGDCRIPAAVDRKGEQGRQRLQLAPLVAEAAPSLLLDFGVVLLGRSL